MTKQVGSMNTDRLSAWFDDELDKKELDELLLDFETDEAQQGQYFAYQTLRTAMHGNLEVLDCKDCQPGITRLMAALDEEKPLKKTFLDEIKGLVDFNVVATGLRRNWAPLAAATVAVSAVLFYPAKEAVQPAEVLIQERQAGSILRASATQVDVMTDGKIDGYLSAHEGVSAVAVPHGGGLASLRTIVHSDDEMTQ